MCRSALALLTLFACTDPVEYGGIPVGDSGLTASYLPGAPTGEPTTSTNPPTDTGSATGSTTTTTSTGTTTGSTTGTTTGSSTPTGTTGGGGPTGTATGNTNTNTYTFTTSTAGSNATSLDCTVVLPADTVLVDSTRAESQPGLHYLVCAQKVLSYSGNFASIYVSDQADAVINGDTNAIWVTSNGGIAVFKTPNTVLAEAGAQVDLSGLTGITEISCPTISFDTSLMPSGGC